MADTSENAVSWLIENAIFSPAAVEGELRSRFPTLNVTHVKRELGLKLFEMELSEKSVALLESPELYSDSICLYVRACIDFSSQKYQSARDLFISALAQGSGSTRSYNWLGYIYQFGLGVEIDAEKALSYYQKGENCGYIYPKLRRLQLDYFSNSKKTIYNALVFRIKFAVVVMQIAFLALINREDERLADIPGIV